jgi:hypothetical protein
VTYFQQRRIELMGERQRKPKYNSRAVMLGYLRSLEFRKTEESRRIAINRLERFWNAQGR